MSVSLSRIDKFWKKRCTGEDKESNREPGGLKRDEGWVRDDHTWWRFITAAGGRGFTSDLLHAYGNFKYSQVCPVFLNQRDYYLRILWKAVMKKNHYLESSILWKQTCPILWQVICNQYPTCTDIAQLEVQASCRTLIQKNKAVFFHENFRIIISEFWDNNLVNLEKQGNFFSQVDALLFCMHQMEIH